MINALNNAQQLIQERTQLIKARSEHHIPIQQIFQKLDDLFLSENSAIEADDVKISSTVLHKYSTSIGITKGS